MKITYFSGILALSVILIASACVFGFAGHASAQQYYTGFCTPNSTQRCVGNNLYWFDSCGNQGSVSQYCPNGCYGNACQNYVNNSYNNNYWYDSCGNQQDLSQTCSGTNIVCKYSQCVYQAPYVAPAPTPAPQYSAHYRIACYANSLYWYDSYGRTTGLYKDCSDSNSCTLDSCGSGKCSNILKCDGSTCAVGSADYNTYCAANSNNQNSQNNQGSLNGQNNNSQNNTINSGMLSISFFAKPTEGASQWQKTVGVGSDGQVYFMISVVNNSGSQINNLNVSANIPTEISSLGNLQIDGVQVSGDIVAGVSIGSLSPGGAKSITFEGKTQSISMPAIKQAVATVSAVGQSQSDSVSVNFATAQSAASVSSSSSTSDIWSFIRRWYLWILVGLVLVFLFVVVFRRLSSNA